MAEPTCTSGSVRIRSPELWLNSRSLPNGHVSQQESSWDLQIRISFTALLTAWFTRNHLQRQLNHLVLRLCVALLLVAPVHAQKTTGTIRGLVTDPSGAVMANVEVLVHNNATGSSRTVATNAEGEYVAAELPVGTYAISVKAPNFREAVYTPVDLHVSSTLVLNLQLSVGATSQQIIVNSGEIQVQTDDAALGEVVNGEQIRELPLNGRNFVVLTQLQPGVSADYNFDTKYKGILSGVDFSVNGNATSSNLFLVDGANDNDVGSNRSILIYPSTEAISEFKMLRNSYGPEYGQASGAIINIVTRSGSNQWHGDVLYFGRNDALNAYEYFAASTAAQARAQGTTLPNGGKDVLRRNDFGYSLGGPIKKNKLFFFLSQEWNIERRGQTRQSCVPTAAERAGDFTTTSCGEPQPTGLVAAGLANPNTPFIMNSLSPAGSLIAQELPLPNLATLLPSGANWSQSLTTPIDWSQFNFRLDYNLTLHQALMFRFTKDNWTNNAPNGNVALGLWGDDPFPALESNWAQPSKQIVARLTSTIGSSMVNDLEFAYSDNRINITAGGTNPGLLPQTTAAIPPGWPEKYKTSKLGIPSLWGGLGAYTSNNALWLVAPWHNELDIYTVRDDFSKVLGKHTARFGGFLGWQGKNEVNNATSASEYPQFSSDDGSTSIPTGNNLANVLAPGAQWISNEQSSNIIVHLRWRDYEMYAADHWKVRRNLTLDLGVRYSILMPTFQPDNQWTSFRENLYNPALGTDACNGLVTVPGYTPCANADKIFGTNFTEAAAGQNRYLKDVNYHLFAPRLGISWDPTGSGNNAVRAGFGIFYQRDRVSPSGYVNAANAPFALNAQFIRTLDAQPATTIPPSGTAPAGGYDPSNTAPYSLQWNIAAEHGFGKNTTLEVGYVGNHAVHQLNNYDVNYVPQSQWINAVFRPFDLNDLRRFPGWGAMTWWLNNGDATYNSLQILFKVQYQTFQLQAAYTWSHSIGNVTNSANGNTLYEGYTWGPDPGLDRGNTLLNRPQVFVANAIYYLPELKHSSSFVRATLGSWELAGISQYASGASTTLYQFWFTDLASENLVALTGTGDLQGRPLATAVPCSGLGGPKVLNPDSVSIIGYQIGTFPKGVEPRGYCRGPGYVNTDFSVDKNWRLNEKLRLQFRMDFFNLFNHPNFRGDVGNFSNGPVYPYGNCGAPDATGVYSPCSQTNNIVSKQIIQQGIGFSTLTKGPREIQYGLKLIF
jgi:hypothetical protein